MMSGLLSFMLKLLNPHEYTQEETLLKDKIFTLNMLILVMGIVVSAFGILRFSQGNIVQALADYLLVAAIVTGYVLLSKDKYRFKAIARFLLFFAMFTTFAMLLFSHEITTRFIWMSVSIYLVFFLLDRKEGWMWFWASMSLLSIIYLVSPARVGINLSEFIILFFGMLLMAVLLSRYEKIKEENVAHYKRDADELQEAVKSKTNELLEQKKMFESLFQQSHDGILLIENQKFIDCNDAVVKLLRYPSKKEFLNLHPSLLSPEYQPDGQLSASKADEMMRICMEKGSNHFQWVHTKADGEEFWCDVMLTRLAVENRELIHVLWRDISEQKALEAQIADSHDKLEQKVKERTQELEYAMQAKAEFLANMSHEIRTPLNAMLGFVEILKKGEHDPERIKQFDIIDNSGNSLLTIINDILDFSKIESGKLAIEQVPFAARQPFEEVQLLFYEKASEKKIDLSLKFDPALPQALVGDTVRIKQVTANFVSNAIKFTPHNGTIAIHVSYDTVKNTLICRVSDSGIGISEESIHTIFEAFSQADSSTTRKFGGTGLGLTICERIIHLMGGKIGVESKIDEGSTFYFELPASVSNEPLLQQHQKEDANEATAKTLQGHVLVIEDNDMNQMLFEVMLQEAGLSCEIATNGAEGVEKFKASAYDLILVDENMPVMNGLEATRQILNYEREHDKKHTPIIAVTANAFEGDRERFLEAGMDDYISKPIEHDVFRDMLHKYLS